MKLNLLYGRTGKVIELPDELTTVVRPGEAKPVADERTAVRDALRSPIGCPALKELVKNSDEVAVVFSDITRPMPYNNILPPLLEELDHVPDNQIVFINATGTHRSNTKKELVEILGNGIVDRFTIVQHNCRADGNLVYVGSNSRGHEIWINRLYMQSSVRILTGFIEPHLFAGFSGGPKTVLPGIAGERTIYANHSAEMIGHPGSGFACTTGNPIWEEQRKLFEANDWEIVEAPKSVLKEKMPMCFCSIWLNMNVLVIDPNTVCVEASETPMLELLDQYGIEVIPVPFYNVASLGGGLHCGTADVYREGKLEDYCPKQIEGF